MSTTDILFNSPALHSLKRNQLVQLCKRHNVKATGKNTDIIERLKDHALTLPSGGSVNNMEIDEEDKENLVDGSREARHRPSDLWEVVMEDIPEESGSMGTHSSTKSLQLATAHGEFGTGQSKTSSVTSSIKALASSFGLKRSMSSNTHYTIADVSTAGSSVIRAPSVRNTIPQPIQNTRDSLSAHAVPYSALPPTPATSLPHTDHFTLQDLDTSMSSVDRPIPGLEGREGVEASATNSTIRLITMPFVPSAPSPPRLKPFEPTFELVPPTPGKFGIPKWPLSPQASQNEEGVYPSLRVPATQDDNDDGVAMPGGLSPARPIRTPKRISQGRSPHAAAANGAILSPPRNEPFIFGSPDPRHSISNTEFKNAASSVLAEMNARLGLSGAKALSIDIMKNGAPARDFGGSGISKDKREPGMRFEKAHEEQFAKMDSITKHYAAKRAIQRDDEAPVTTGAKRKSSTVGKGRPSVARPGRRSGARVISAGTRKKMALPGGFGDDSDDDETEDVRRTSKRPRVSQLTKELDKKRVSIAPLPSKGPAGDDSEDEETEQARKEREAIKRKLEYNKAKRRSSMGRVSVGGGKAPLIANKKAATSRFGFLNSAKSLVKSVWNRGAGAPSKTSSIPVPKPAPAPTPVAAKPPVPERKPPSHLLTKPVPVALKQKDNKKPTLPASRPSVSAARPTTRSTSDDSGPGQFLKPSVPASRIASTSSVSSRSRSRSPIPAFNGDSVRSSRTNLSVSASGSTSGSLRSRLGSSVGVATKTSASRVSSMGTRGSSASKSAQSSVGTRSSSVSSAVGSMGTRSRPPSTLHMPTASSLAKMQSNVRPPQSSAAPRGPRPLPQKPELANVSEVQDALTQITNAQMSAAPRSAGVHLSPSKIPVSASPAKQQSGATIFSTPLPLIAAPELGNDINPITGIPSPTREDTSSGTLPQPAAKERTRVPSTRRPRISRSRVIAKLGAKRAAVDSASGSMTKATPSKGGRTRSSVGTAARRSLGGKAVGSSRALGGDPSVRMSAKKRARQSEYVRRRSAKAQLGVGPLAFGGEGMDVDDI
ncbi:hypothetical protein BD410DRAFT_781909 [Rickenella mellea]|uniref:SAP domain-containing protein n=1 Tax=Rickenella mellea TaxID=50990 RepID=A0A4Y7QKT6_9AGAM|nr:hypothetical protein BD410DRAFT_781909 [Rickenella mellea]